MNRNRQSSRIARRQTKNSEKTGDIVNGTGQNSTQSGQCLSQIFDDIDLLFGNHKSKFYPIYTPPNKKVNTHNLAEIPSLQSDEDSIIGFDNNSQNGDVNTNGERNITPRKQYGKRKNANSLIESRNKFRQLLNQMQTKYRPINVQVNNNKNDSAFDGYELKSRRVKFEPKKLRKDNNSNEQTSPTKGSQNEFVVKVHEKSVDLTSYCKMNPNQYIPLYPICRLWIRDRMGIPEMLRGKRNPQPPPLTEPPDPDGPYSADPVDVCHMPKPEPLPVDENGNIINLRIPEKVRLKKYERKYNDLSFINELKHLTPSEMLKIHMPNWKQIRRENLDALKQNEKRYRHSFSILKSIFDKANLNNSESGRDLAYYKYPPYESEDLNETQKLQQQQPSQSSSTVANASEQREKSRNQEQRPSAETESVVNDENQNQLSNPPTTASSISSSKSSSPIPSNEMNMDDESQSSTVATNITTQSEELKQNEKPKPMEIDVKIEDDESETMQEQTSNNTIIIEEESEKSMEQEQESMNQSNDNNGDICMEE